MDYPMGNLRLMAGGSLQPAIPSLFRCTDTAVNMVDSARMYYVVTAGGGASAITIIAKIPAYGTRCTSHHHHSDGQRGIVGRVAAR